MVACHSPGAVCGYASVARVAGGPCWGYGIHWLQLHTCGLAPRDSDIHLLDTTTYELRSDLQPIFRQEKYAILSHRWVGQEVNFDQLKDETAGLRSGMPPVRTPQIDSCYIDRANAVEQTESINSMFKWYRDAKVCITYLSDVQKLHVDVPGSECLDSVERDGPSLWFSRGWTLQELLAPQDMRFYDKDWDFIGTEMTLAPLLERITGIQTHYLTGEKHFGTAFIATKMSWMAGRTTTRVEDIAYSMLGIFNINMTTQYGEGMRAFMRLQQTLLSTSKDESLPLKTFEMAQDGILAPIPPVATRAWEGLLILLGAVVLVGVCIAADITNDSIAKRGKKDFEYALKCWLCNQGGGLMPVHIYLRPVSTGYKRIRCCEFGRGDIGANSRSSEGIEEAIIFQPATGYLD
ncbi:HET-domain-containing protein [Xylaria longipes]|nr:HET-domain-containing protein [Xylaria longipes]